MRQGIAFLSLLISLNWIIIASESFSGKRLFAYLWWTDIDGIWHRAYVKKVIQKSNIYPNQAYVK